MDDSNPSNDPPLFNIPSPSKLISSLPHDFTQHMNPPTSGALHTPATIQAQSVNSFHSAGANLSHLSGDRNVYPPNVDFNTQVKPVASETQMNKLDILNNLSEPESGTNMAPVTRNALRENTGTSMSDYKAEELQDAYAAYSELFPSLNNVTGMNYSEILALTLRKCSSYISLDDFYNLLFNAHLVDKNVSNDPADGILMHRIPPSESRTEAIKLCHLVLHTFQTRNVVGVPHGSKLMNNLRKSAIRPGEILRSFLAVKILLDSMKAVDDFSSSISRLSLYKAYYIISKKLAQKYTYTDSSRKYAILSQSQIGKIVRQSFPGLSARRKGKRGGSIYYYRGMAWNPELINSEILHLIGLSLPDIDNFLEGSSSAEESASKTLGLSSLAPENIVLTSLLPLDSNSSSSNFSWPKPLLSFVDVSNSFRSSDCFLRSWHFEPGRVPQQSQWSKNNMRTSVKALRKYNVDIETSIFEVQTKEYSADSMVAFLEDVIEIFRLLVRNGISEEAYLHLYLVILLFIFPIVCAFDKEAPLCPRENLQDSLTRFSANLGKEFSKSPSVNENNLKAFVMILRKLASFNKLLSSCVPTSLVKPVMKVMGGDPQLAMDSQMVELIDGEMEKLISHTFVTACNGFGWKFIGIANRENPEYLATFIKMVTKRYMTFAKTLLMRSSEISAGMTKDDLANPTYDLPSKIFWQSTQTFHEVFMSDPLILQLPMKLVELWVAKVTDSFQTELFHRFRNLAPELSTEVFKTYWIYNTEIQQYLSILSEIVAISVRLS